MVNLITLNYNQNEYTLKCIESISNPCKSSIFNQNKKFYICVNV